jgi:ribosomal protein S6--L-glutamate ligase
MNCSDAQPHLIALEKRLRECPQVITLGVRPNFDDYDDHAQTLIRNASKIYYPSAFYAELLDAMGKATFPSYHTYKFAQDKIKQTALFKLAGIPHPRTRVFYGPRQKSRITHYFEFPFIAKIPRGSAMGRGVFLVRNAGELDDYCNVKGPAYIQEYLPIDRDIRVVVIGGRVVHAYWRVAATGDYRTNVSAGGRIELDDVPPGALRLACETAKCCGWDDVGIDICEHQGTFYVLEGNMKYGKEGFRQAGLDYQQIMSELISKGVI